MKIDLTAIKYFLKRYQIPLKYLLTLPYYFLYYFSFSTFTEIKIELNKLYGQPMIKFTK